MRIRVASFFVCCLSLLALATFSASSGIWGCGSSDDSAADTGSATVSTLESLPSVDLSTYDKSGASASTSLPALTSGGIVVSNDSGSKNFGENVRGTTRPSRSGCEVNSIKDQTFQMSQMAQMPRCFLEGMEKAGLFTIPTDGSLAIFSIAPPGEQSPGGAPEKGKFCDDVPACMTKARSACEGGKEGPKGKAIIVRIGKPDNNTLQIDLCQDGKLVDESLYQSTGATYTLNATHIDSFGGEEQKGAITMTVNLGATGTVKSGAVDLGTDGTVDASLKGQGGFGSMASRFQASAADGSNIVRGAFKSGFTDECTGKSNAMTGRIYSQFTTKGTAKFSITGTMPPMPFSEMIPFDVPAAQKGQFAQQIGAELGMALGASDVATVFFCMNPKFNPANPTATKVSPMIALPADGKCPEITHSGTESFEATTKEEKGDFKARRVQVYTTIADTSSPFFTAVKDFDLSALDPNIGTIAFVRNFDCSGTATAVDFTKAAPDVMKSAMQTCFAMEEEARARDGIKGRRCEQGDMENELNNTAKQGGGGTNFGRYGGELTLTTGGSLATASSPSKMFIKVVDATASKYCFPIDQDCQEFTVASNAATGLSISLGGGNTLTAVGFNAVDPATTATLTISTAQGTSGTANYTISRPSFTGGGTPPAAQLPAPCQQRGFNEADCRAYCGQPNSGC